MKTRMNTLKKEFLELLDKDIEFRYAIAGYLGLSEILKRLDALSEEQVNLRKEQTKIWKEIEGIKEEQIKLRREQVKLREEQTKIWKEIEGIREEQIKIWKEIEGIKEEQVELRKEQIKLREDFNKMLEVMNRMDIRLNRVERTLEKLTVDIEDEAKSIIKNRIKEEFGIDIELTSLILPEFELNIYGVSNNICIIGEATVRSGVDILEELLKKIELIKEKYPDKLRKNVIIVIYVCLPLPGLIEEAKKNNIWILKATQDFYKPKIIIKSD